jgi:agmatine deiminase
MRRPKYVVQVPSAEDSDIWANDERQQDQILSAATDAKGRAIQITKLKGPRRSKIRQGSSKNFVDSYANYYVCNGAVIVAQFGDASADAAAKTALASAFPGRVIEQLNIDNLGIGGGGIHCVTLTQPAP